MTLPLGGAWPPPPHGIAMAQQALWSAWLEGDPEGLSAAYANVGDSGSSDFFRYENGKSGNLAQTGIVNRVARFFWSRPSPSGGRKARLHVPLAGDIATASADLLFSEPPQFILDEDANDAAKERVDELLNTGEFHATLIESAEIVAGLGGGWLRCVWDTDVSDSVMIDAVDADAAIGEWRWGQLAAVTFFTEYGEGNGNREVIRHLERHEPGAVFHGLYSGDVKTLGHPMALTDHPSCAPYAELINEDGAILTGVDTLTAAYVANMRPQVRWRKVDGLRRLGRSDFDGVEPLMDALDETYTSWMRDVRLGRSRILVPEFMLKDMGKGQGAAWDEDQEVFTQLKMAPSEQTLHSQITPQQFTIRVQEHADTAADLVDQILRKAGYSPSTFGEGTEGVATATEVTSREKQSERTRDRKARYWTQALTPLLNTWLALDAAVFKTGAVGTVGVKWADTSQADPEVMARTTETLNRAVAVSTDTKVRMLHPDWSEEQIAAEVDLVRAESGQAVPDIGPVA